ncbi:MAG: HIT domain-containing protein [Actinobacteria bacterium]|nr:HIT domain-containing protein [Actinomycetota bacterium]MCA1720079.1 HIT domain-containing protein [Actinomycetota bacterium]
MVLELPVDEPCSFCEYLAGRRPYTILDRDEQVSTLVTRQQRGRLHVLVIPTAHRPTILDVQPCEYGALMSTVVRASRAIAAAVDAEGIAVWQKNGVADGQTIPHVHFHVAATLAEGGTAWGPVPTLSVEKTDELAEQLRPFWDG